MLLVSSKPYPSAGSRGRTLRIFSSWPCWRHLGHFLCSWGPACWGRGGPGTQPSWVSRTTQLPAIGWCAHHLREQSQGTRAPKEVRESQQRYVQWQLRLHWVLPLASLGETAVGQVGRSLPPSLLPSLHPSEFGLLGPGAWSPRNKTFPAFLTPASQAIHSLPAACAWVARFSKKHANEKQDGKYWVGHTQY